MRSTPLALLLAYALLAAPSLFAQDPPVIKVTNRRRASGGASSPLFGLTEAGEQTFVKPDRPVRGLSAYGNLEAEVLASRMLTELGILTPQTRMVAVAPRYWDLSFRPQRHLQAEFMDQKFTGGGALHSIPDLTPEQLRSMDVAQLRRLQLIDSLIGNGDRHRGNIHFTETAGGRVVPVALDHNMAFAGREVSPDTFMHRNFLPGYDGVEVDTGRVNDARLTRHMSDAGSLERIMGRNVLYQELLYAGLYDEAGRGAYRREARTLQAEFSDAFIERHVSQLTDAEIGAADPQARRTELVEVLKARRDGLVEALDAMYKKLGRQYRAAVGSNPPQLKDVIPRELLERAALSDWGRVELTLQVLGRAIEGPGDIYSQLRRENVPVEVAKEITRRALHSEGLQVTEAQFSNLEKLAQEEARTTARRKGASAAESTVLAGKRPTESTFEVITRDGKPVVRDVRGGALPSSHSQAVAPLVERVLEVAKPGEGERVLIQRDAFASAEGPPRYQAQVLDAAGNARAKVVLTAPAGQPVHAQLVEATRAPVPTGPSPLSQRRNREIQYRLQTAANELAAKGQYDDAKALAKAARAIEATHTQVEGGPTQKEVLARPEVKEAIRRAEAFRSQPGAFQPPAETRSAPPRRTRYRPRGRG